MFPDHTFCTLTLSYRSGASHVLNTDVSKARKLAKEKIDRKAVRFVKVIVPDPNSRRIAVFLWTPESKWSRTNAISRT